MNLFFSRPNGFNSLPKNGSMRSLLNLINNNLNNYSLVQTSSDWLTQKTTQFFFFLQNTWYKKSGFIFCHFIMFQFSFELISLGLSARYICETLLWHRLGTDKSVCPHLGSTSLCISVRELGCVLSRLITEMYICPGICIFLAVRISCLQ